jgi:hypothetical protein
MLHLRKVAHAAAQAGEICYAKALDAASPTGGYLHLTSLQKQRGRVSAQQQQGQVKSHPNSMMLTRCCDSVGLLPVQPLQQVTGHQEGN